MKIVNRTGYRKIDDASEYFYKMVPKIIEGLKALPPYARDFTYTEEENWKVIEKIEWAFGGNTDIIVELYTPVNPWTSAIGYSNGTNTIFVNERKINYLSSYDYAGNIAHEWMHVLGFSHGDNYITEEKKKSVPYAFGYLISGESAYPIIKEIKPAVKEVACYRSWKTLWLKKVCY